jgi:two-component system, NtrC family, response regulator GlrR
MTQPPLDPRLQGFVGTHPSFATQVAKLVRFAACEAGVLIQGETGTGKEVFAQALHYLSSRASKPWVAVNCGAIPVELIESELFGHVRGAYTSASSSRQGLVAEAEGGTLFLDDIDCLPLLAQAKLLRFLQEHEYRAVGCNRLQHADVRVVSASNRPLRALANQGAFREDLYYRLSVLALSLPPLREREGDVPLLAQHFVRQFGGQSLSDGALARLAQHDWPGNVRELAHVVERAVLLSNGPLVQAQEIEIDGQVTQATQAIGPATAALAPCSLRAAKAQLVADFERRSIEQLLAQHAGNITQAAQAAGKNRRAFFALMRKYQIEGSAAQA